MARRHLNAGTLLAPLPAVMVSVGDMENANIITVAWTGILSSDPARAYVSVRPSRHSHKILVERGEFVINLTTEALARATDYAGIYTGAKVDKFEKLGLTKEPSKAVLAPTIKESPLSLECRVFEVIKSGTHDIFMADIVSVSCDESLLDEKGKICLERAGLMTYSHGEYYALGQPLGRFGFSTDKTRPVSQKKTVKPSENKQKADINTKKQKLSPGKKKAKGKPSGAKRAQAKRKGTK